MCITAAQQTEKSCDKINLNSRTQLKINYFEHMGLKVNG